VHKFLQSKHQHYKIADPYSLISRRFSKVVYNSHIEVNSL